MIELTLMPFDSITVVTGELVVEVVVSLTEGDKSSDDVIPRGVAVVKRLLTEPMGQRVDTESSLLNEKDSEDTSVDISTDPVTPAKTSDKSREDQSHENDNPKVMLVLPNDNRILVQIRNVGASNAFGVLLHDHPSQMRVQKTLADTVRVLIGVGITMVSPVVS